MLGRMLIELSQVERWLYDTAPQEYKDQPTALGWARIAKITEEAGEAVDAYIRFTGGNPRKERTTDMRPVLDELADVAITAIVAILHFTQSESAAGTVLVDRVQVIMRRMVEMKVAAQRGNLGDWAEPTNPLSI